MQTQLRTPASIGLALAVGLFAVQASALSGLTGANSLTSYFTPNNTSPHLEIDGPGSVTNSGGVAVFPVGLGDPTFSLHIDFKDGGGVDFYDQMFLTAALAPGVDYTGVSIQLTFGGSVELAETVFVDAALFGLPFPGKGMKGIGNGAGDYLSLNGARLAAWDLMTDLDRDVGGPIILDMQIFGRTSEEQIVRFDTFGAFEGNIVGNNPNSGSAGVGENPVPEPGAALLYGVGLALVGARHSRRAAARR